MRVLIPLEGMRKRVLLGFLFFFTTFFMATGQKEEVGQNSPAVKLEQNRKTTPIAIPSEKIEWYKEQSDFQYDEYQHNPNWWGQFKNWVGSLWDAFWHWLWGDYKAGGILAFLIKALPYLIVLGCIIFVVWLFIKLNPGASLLQANKQPEVLFTEEEELLRNKDLRKLIAQALRKKDYRLAVRYHYLWLLKTLSDREYIQYASDKTNTDYLQELRTEKIHAPFQQVTMLYDYIWYGNFPLSEAAFEHAQRHFQAIEPLIPEKHHV